MKTHRGALELTDTGTDSGLFLNSANATDPTTEGQIAYVTGVGFRAKPSGSAFTIGGGGAGAGTWDELYANDKEVSITGTTLTFTGSSAAANTITITQDASATGACLKLTHSKAGEDDITGSAWNVTQAGFLYVKDIGHPTGAADLNIDGGVGAGKVIINATATGDIELNRDTVIASGKTLTVTGTATATRLDLTAGDMTISDGSLAISDDDTAASLTITNTANFVSTTSGIVTIVADTATTGHVVDINADAFTSGTLIHLDVTGATFTGEYIDCTDGGTSEFKVMRYGATTIRGNAAGTDALTITKGDLEITDSDTNEISSVDGTGTLLTLDNEGGVIASGSSILKLDSGGVMDAGAYGLHIVFNAANDAGTTMVYLEPDAGSVGINIDGATTATREALYIDADPTAHDVVYIHSDAVIAADKALLNLNSAGDLADGGNILRVDAADATPASGAVYVEFDFAGITSTHENIGLLIDANAKKVQALYIDADPTTGSVAYMHSDAVLHADQGVLFLESDGDIASGGNVLRIVTGGTPDTGAIVLEMDAKDDCQAVLIDSDSATTHAVEIKGSGVLKNNKAMLFVTSDGASLEAGAALVRIEDSSFTAAGATVYGLEIDIEGTNMEALLVTAGTCSFAEAITVVSGGIAVTGNSSIDGACVFNDSSADVDFRVETDSSEYAFEINGEYNNVSINATGLNANYDLALLGDGVLMMTETSTPTATTNYGKVYCKNDNKLYFQDGAGSEHEIAFA